MKALIATVLASTAFAFAPLHQAQATVDGLDRVYIVVHDFNGDFDPMDYVVERAPIVGCYGVEQGPRLAAWTTEYKATQNIGCGGVAVYENINALTCATVVSSKESDDYMSFSEITLDISKCEDKKNSNFVKAIEASARKNFPQTNKSKPLKLTLIK